MSDRQDNPHDPGDGGRHGETHSSNEFGGEHNTLSREGSHISWDTDKHSSYVWGSGHATDHDSGKVIDWD